MRLGEHKDLAGNLQPTADYPNYYGTWAVEQIVRAEDRSNVSHQGAPPRMTIDMTGLGLKEDLIENEGLDLGRNRTRRPYFDTSQTPANPRYFDHTQDGSVHPRHDHQHVPVMSGALRTGRAFDARPDLSPTTDFSAYLDRMLAAAQTGDDAAFRKMTQTLAHLPAGRELRAEAIATVDRQEQWAAQQQWEQQQFEQQQFEQQQARQVEARPRGMSR